MRLELLLERTFAKLPGVRVFLSDLTGQCPFGPRPCYGPNSPTRGAGLGETMVRAYNSCSCLG